MNKHFSNTGQILQLLVAVIGLIIAGRNAYPSIELKDFSSIGPLFFYLFVILSVAAAFQLFRHRNATPQLLPQPRPISETPKPSERLPPDAQQLKIKCAVLTFKMKRGERRLLGEAALNVHHIIITINDIKNDADGTPCADVTIKSFLDLDIFDKRIKTSEDKSRYLIPASDGRMAQIGRTYFDRDSLSLDAFRIEHLNPHEHEFELSVLRVY
jgi:hypothetical protein